MGDIPWFRELYDDILKYKGQKLFADVLDPWIENAQPAIADLRRFGQFSPYDQKDKDAQFAMWNLYALSRVNDVLLLVFQQPPTDGRAPCISSEQYEQFFSQLGFVIVECEGFTPFHHEIVQVEQSELANKSIRILERFWPGLMFGELLFFRSGVAVTGGRDHVVKEIAEQSTLYFTFRRAHRRTSDLSMGWGSNSQWRTDFRRDYESGGKWIYNADGENLLNEPEKCEKEGDGLTHEERIELCKNRCFIITPKPNDDLWPFDDRFEEPRC